MIDPARLPVWLKMTHGIGSIAYGVKDNGFSVFLLIYYNQVLGLDPGLVGAAIMIALIVDAFADPIIGELSDRTQSRWGRRLPWLYGAAIPLGIMWVMLWHPPTGNTTMTIAWLIGCSVIVRSLVAMCEVPSIALIPELTGDYHERTRIMRYRYLFAWATGLIMLMLAYGVFFTGPKGVADAAGYNRFALCGAALMAGSVIFSALGQHRLIAHPSPPPQSAQTLRQIFGEMKASLSNRAYLWLIFAALFALINQSLSFALSNYVLVYVWQLDRIEMLVYAVALFGSVVVAFFIVGILSERLGKRNAAIFCAILSVSMNTALYLCWLLRIAPGVPQAPSAVFFIGFVMLTYCFAISLMILTSSMVADVVEASQTETGRRSEGLFYAGFFFMQKCAIGIGTFLAGMILTYAHFPKAAVAGKVPLAALDALAFAYMIVLFVVGVTGVLVYTKFPISREDHERRLHELQQEADA
jgi:glycoside/pentoside/hexuronide:cation symporter, GPH family